MNWERTAMELENLMCQTVDDVKSIEELLEHLDYRQEKLCQEVGEEHCIEILEEMSRNRQMLAETRERYMKSIGAMKELICKIRDVLIPPQI